MQLVGLVHGQRLALDVHDEQDVGHVRHVAQAADALVQARQLAAQEQRFLLGQAVQLAAGVSALKIDHVLDALPDGAEVGQRAAQPAGGDVGHAAALGLCADGFLRLLLGADEEHQAAFAHGVAHDAVGGVDLAHGLLQVNDVDAVAFGEDEVRIFGCQRRVRCPKWTPASNNDFIEMTDTCISFSVCVFRLLRPGGQLADPNHRDPHARARPAMNRRVR